MQCGAPSIQVDQTCVYKYNQLILFMFFTTENIHLWDHEHQPDDPERGMMAYVAPIGCSAHLGLYSLAL